MSELDAYGLLMSTLDDLEEVSLQIKAQRDEAVKHCQSIVNLMQPTDALRPADSEIVVITASLWKRIYANAKKGAE